ncbi:MAG: LptF/LptG family permease [Candidatus Omnitrophica bacterium]|nr:LptF/LptG family permease [Candidatus Omnitrophota bacterium]
MFIGNLVKIINLIIGKGIEILAVFKLFGYLIPYLLTYTLPIAILSAILLLLGRLSSDNEIIGIQASGINIIYITVPLLIVSLIFALFLLILNDRIIPSNHFAFYKAVKDIGIRNPAAFLEPGVFINNFDKYIIFIYHIEGNKLFNIRIYEPQSLDKIPRTIIAKRGEFISLPEKSMIKLKLIDGTSDEPDPDNPENFYKLNFKTYFINLNLTKESYSEEPKKKPKDMNIKELKVEIEKTKRMGIEPLPLITHLHKRIALSFSSFVFVLIGIPLGLIARRKERTINFALTFLIIGIYYLSLLGCETLSIEGFIKPEIGIWLPNIAFIVVGILLFYRVCGY